MHVVGPDGIDGVFGRLLPEAVVMETVIGSDHSEGKPWLSVALALTLYWPLDVHVWGIPTELSEPTNPVREGFESPQSSVYFTGSPSGSTEDVVYSIFYACVTCILTSGLRRLTRCRVLTRYNKF